MTRDPLDIPAPGPVFNFAAHLLARNAERGAKTAYVDEHESLSYGMLAERVRRLAQALLQQGVRREERVLLLMHDCCDWPVCFLGALYAGIVPVAVNTLLTAEDYAYMLRHSRAQAALVSPALLPVLQRAMAQCAHELRAVLVAGPDTGATEGTLGLRALLEQTEALPQCADTGADDPGFWLYSSGSTGKPKGTLHTHANPYWTAELYGRGVLGLRADDVCFSAAKLFFAYGLGNALSFPLSVGATTVLMAERPTPQAVAQRWRGLAGGRAVPQPTVFFGAPTGYAGLLAYPELPQRKEVALRMASSAGEALPAELGLRFAERMGVDIVDGIGSTEMLHIFLSNRPGAVRYGTTGWPVAGYTIELRDEEGQPLAESSNAMGELFVQGPSAALLYWGDRARSRQTFRGDWTRSGDKYLRNSDGSYTYCGRSDDMLKVSGIYVSPFEIEATLAQHPGVLEAAVVGYTDADGLTKAKAYVVPKPGASIEAGALRDFLKDRLAPFKCPRAFVFVADLPKTATGKIQRFRLRALENAGR
ncbi:MAG: benzoate-CoA ligase family protein [Rhodoferax sp.]